MQYALLSLSDKKVKTITTGGWAVTFNKNNLIIMKKQQQKKTKKKKKNDRNPSETEQIVDSRDLWPFFFFFYNNTFLMMYNVSFMTKGYRIVSLIYFLTTLMITVVVMSTHHRFSS